MGMTFQFPPDRENVCDFRATVDGRACLTFQFPPHRENVCDAEQVARERPHDLLRFQFPPHRENVCDLNVQLQEIRGIDLSVPS